MLTNLLYEPWVWGSVWFVLMCLVVLGIYLLR